MSNHGNYRDWSVCDVTRWNRAKGMSADSRTRGVANRLHSPSSAVNSFALFRTVRLRKYIYNMEQRKTNGPGQISLLRVNQGAILLIKLFYVLRAS
jgi:hypothetical protein